MLRPQNVQSPMHHPTGRVRGELLLHCIRERIIYGKPHRTEYGIQMCIRDSSYVSRIEKKALEELRAMMRKGASAGKG